MKVLRDMARPRPAPRRSYGNSKPAAVIERRKTTREELPSDDEVDKFHKLKDKLSLDPTEDEASSEDDGEELDDEAVYNLSASEGSTDEDGKYDEDHDEDDEDGSGHYAQRGADFVL